MEKLNNDIPFEHQMMFIIKDYDRKVTKNMELRREVEKLSTALEEQGTELKKIKKKLKKMPQLKDKANRLDACIHKKEKFEQQANQMYKCVTYCRNQLRHLLAMVEVPGLRELEQRMGETLKKYDE